VAFCESLGEALDRGPFEGALYALKSFDTAKALDAMRPFAERMPPVICFSNGVENEAALADALGKAKVVAATVTSAIGRRGPGTSSSSGFEASDRLHASASERSCAANAAS
jgi:ketopantoate reductase